MLTVGQRRYLQTSLVSGSALTDPEAFDLVSKQILERQKGEPLVPPPEGDYRVALRAAKEAFLTFELASRLYCYEPITGVIYRKEALNHLGRPVTEGEAVGRAIQSPDNYLVLSVGGHLYLQQRVVWLLHYRCWPAKCIDHINGVKTDNRISNLREADNRENHKNRRDTSPHGTGVVWEPSRLAWKAYCRFGYVMHNIGRFSTAADAAKARETYLGVFNAICD